MGGRVSQSSSSSLSLSLSLSSGRPPGAQRRLTVVEKLIILRGSLKYSLNILFFSSSSSDSDEDEIENKKTKNDYDDNNDVTEKNSVDFLVREAMREEKLKLKSKLKEEKKN